MSAFRRYAVTAALAGLISLTACGPTPASQPGAARSPSPAASTQAPPATTPAPVTVTPAPSGTPTASQQPVLRLDSRGSAVLTLQQRLAALHYFDVAKADGVFGPGTYHAVVAFQKVQGLTRDGIAGPATWARLARPYVPAARYRLAATSLEVNLAKQVIYYVSGGTIQRIIGSVLLVKVDETVVVRQLSSREMTHWQRNPGLFKDPTTALEELQRASQNEPQPASPGNAVSQTQVRKPRTA